MVKSFMRSEDEGSEGQTFECSVPALCLIDDHPDLG